MTDRLSNAIAPVHGRSKRALLALLLVAGLALLVVWAAEARPKHPAIRISPRQFTITWSGDQVAAYSSSDGTPFNQNRAGYQGCIFSQTGNTDVQWKNVWRIKAIAKIGRHFSHIKLLSLKRVSGPNDPHATGSSSQISGSNKDALNHDECSASGRAGAFNCTADSVTAKLPRGEAGSLKIEADPSRPSTYDVDVPGFLTTSASYTGQQPSPQWTCAQDIGTNASPGGFVGNDLLGLASLGFFRIKAGDLIALKLHHVYKDGTAVLPDGKGWLIHHFPSEGDSCAPRTTTDEKCSYTRDTNRAAELIVKRVK